MAACIAEGRLAPANWRTPGRQDRPAAPVFSFVVPKTGPKTGPKNGAKNLSGRRKGFQNGGPVSGTRVLHTQSAPLCDLCAVSSGDSGTFRLFSWQWAWQSLIQVSQYIYIYITQNRLVVLHATHQSSSHAVWFQDANPTARSMRPMIPRNLGWAPGGPGATARKRVKHIEHWNYGYGNNPLGMMRNSNGFKFQLTNVCTDWGISVPDIRGSGNLAWASPGNIWLCHPRSNIQIYSSAEGRAHHNSVEDVRKGLVNRCDALHVNPPTS